MVFIVPMCCCWCVLMVCVDPMYVLMMCVDVCCCWYVLLVCVVCMCVVEICLSQKALVCCVSVWVVIVLLVSVCLCSAFVHKLFVFENVRKSSEWNVQSPSEERKQSHQCVTVEWFLFLPNCVTVLFSSYQFNFTDCWKSRDHLFSLPISTVVSVWWNCSSLWYHNWHD